MFLFCTTTGPRSGQCFQSLVVPLKAPASTLCGTSCHSSAAVTTSQPCRSVSANCCTNTTDDTASTTSATHGTIRHASSASAGTSGTSTAGVGGNFEFSAHSNGPRNGCRHDSDSSVHTVTDVQSPLDNIVVLPRQKLLTVVVERNEVSHQINIIIYHDFLPTPRRGSHVKSGKTHTQSSRYTP